MTLKKAFKLVLQYFKGDYEKTLLWFGNKNPGLGNQAPLVMIVMGRSDKLCKFIAGQLKGEFP
jgi:hypothetical protein